MNKSVIYEKYNVEFKAGKINAPEFGMINPLLVNGNAKLGKGVWTFSTLPTNEIFSVSINNKDYSIKCLKKKAFLHRVRKQLHRVRTERILWQCSK